MMVCRHSPLNRVFSGSLIGVFLTLAPGGAALAQDPPLHAQIDELMAAATGGMAAPVSSDAEFLRRVSLSLNGVPPTSDELRLFLADQTPNKRELAVDRLLAHPLYVRHFAEVFDVMLMERRGNTHVSADEWHNYLVQSLRDNKPWNQLAREVLAADGVDPNLRPAARFYLDRGSEPNLITRDVGRIFFGRDWQCAQCHDHPLIDGYHQADYHGLLAFFVPGFELKLKEGDKEKAFYAERAGSDVQFESVFVKGTKHLTAPRVPGDVELAEPVLMPGEEYEVRPADNVRPVPKYSRRAKLAELSTNGNNRAFNENIANRLWAQMMGQGLVHPVDLHHADNPPSNPALMRLLGERFAAMGFDVKAFVRELVLTQVYRRSLDPPADVLAKSAAAAPAVAQLEAEREALSAAANFARMAFDAALAEWNTAEAALLPVVAEVDQVRAKYNEVLKKVDDAQKAVSDAQAQATTKQGIAQTVTDASTKAQEAVAKLPQDQELTAAAQKFAERAKQLADEVAALLKGVEEKTAALQAPMGELEAARPGMNEALQKVPPVRDVVKQKEQAMLAAREQMSAAALSLAAHDRRLEAAKLLACVKTLDDQAIAATQAIPVKQEELEAARNQVTEYTAVVSQHQTELAAAEQAQAAGGETLAKIQQEHALQAETAKAVADAFTSADAARQKLPDDATLKDAAEKLKAKFDELAAALAAHQRQVDAATATASEAAAKALAAKQALDGVLAEKTRREQAAAAAEAAVPAAQTQAQSSRAAVDEALSQLTSQWSSDFTLAALQPLSPEQLCWSIFKVTGVYDRYRQTEIAELDKASPLSEEAKQDPAQVAGRERDIEQRTYDKLKGNVSTFASVYGAAAGQPQTDFFATADQALFAANGGSIINWVAPAGGNVTERVINEPDAKKAAEELYLAVLSRMPNEEEVTDVTNYLAARPNDRPAAAQELVWGLLASAEFRFSY
jgi:hypothetical protein